MSLNSSIFLEFPNRKIINDKKCDRIRPAMYYIKLGIILMQKFPENLKWRKTLEIKVDELLKQSSIVGNNRNILIGCKQEFVKFNIYKLIGELKSNLVILFIRLVAFLIHLIILSIYLVNFYILFQCYFTKTTIKDYK